ncbi:invasion associated locus B family protein [Bradyrhizobium mercantei]|uniref:invasion associated locus B family protein n=1 Tax=Bradyrhizobium mercantei TaxID=1904807 RepID=UPI00097816BB|nr:invasion associated locus B family protein [Bradyrhizobium mercantei]
MKLIPAKWTLIGILHAGLCLASAEAQQRITATYDDWTVACVGVPKSCEITSTQQAQAQGQLVVASQITLSGIGREKPIRISVQIPPNVWLASGIKLMSAGDDNGIVAAFRWCIPGRCLADVEVNQQKLRELTVLGDQKGFLVFKDAEQKDQRIPMSFKGLGSAFDMVLKGAQISPSAHESEDVRRFDGQWQTEAECAAIPPSVAKANWTTSSKIENGQITAKFGSEGKPGSGTFEGRIAASGSFELVASGLTGDSKSTTNNAPERTPYTWKATGTFSDSGGTATRIGGRLCTVSFSRDKKG